MTWGNTFSILALTVSIAAAYFALRAARANERANYLSRLNVLFDLQTHYQSQLERNAEFAKSFPNTVGGRKAEESLGALDTKIREIAREIGKYHAKVVCSEAPNMGQIIDHLNEKILVSNLLFASVGASSRNMASFSGWLLAGFAGVAAVVLNNLAEVSNHLSPFALHVIFTSFFVSAILAIVARILSVLVVAASTGSAIGRAEGTAAANSGPPPDVPWLFAEVERAVIWPVRSLVQRSFAKVAQGNLTAYSRVFACVAQVQGVVTLVQALVALWAIGVVACTVTF